MHIDYIKKESYFWIYPDFNDSPYLIEIVYNKENPKQKTELLWVQLTNTGLFFITGIKRESSQWEPLEIYNYSVTLPYKEVVKKYKPITDKGLFAIFLQSSDIKEATNIILKNKLLKEAKNTDTYNRYVYYLTTNPKSHLALPDKE